MSIFKDLVHALGENKKRKKIREYEVREKGYGWDEKSMDHDTLGSMRISDDAKYESNSDRYSNQIEGSVSNTQNSPYPDPFDPLNPRATADENLPPEPKITPPPPLSQQIPTHHSPSSNADDSYITHNATNATSTLPQDRGVPNSPTPTPIPNPNAPLERVKEDYGILPENELEKKAREDRMEEIINELRFIKAQNDMIMEILKRLERKLP